MIKAEAGGYLWRKLGMLGLVTGAHTFVPKQFMHLVSISLLSFLIFRQMFVRSHCFQI